MSTESEGSFLTTGPPGRSILINFLLQFEIFLAGEGGDSGEREAHALLCDFACSKLTLLTAQQANKSERQDVEARSKTLFRKPADQEDGRLMSQNNHLMDSGYQVIL